MTSTAFATPALDVFDIIEKAQAAPSVNALTLLFGTSFDSFGYTSFVMTNVLNAAGAAQVDARFGCPNLTWRSHYTGQNYQLHDDLIPRVKTGHEPFTWRDSLAYGISKSTLRMFDEAKELGVGDGFVLPVHYADHSSTAVLLTRPDPAEIGPNNRARLFLLSSYFASVGKRLEEGTLPPQQKESQVLSPRQRECLQWVRAGKSDWDISVILNLSEHTVNEHLEAARKRLGVRTRTQAVIEAIARGLIQL
jgi:DNA-binding CsgD family transcriptional regulator